MNALRLHLGLVGLLLGMGFLLPDYHQGNLSRILVLATYAMGYNILFGYTGLLSLGHAMFFAAGMYGLGLPMQHLGFPPLLAFPFALIVCAGFAGLIAVLTLRTIGVGFMIVTLMFAQACYLAILYFGTWTRGDEGFVIAREARQILGFDLAHPDMRFVVAWVLFSVVLLLIARLVGSPFGRILVALRENEERTRMLGYDVHAHKIAAVVISGTIAGAAGASYGLLFGYVGATFASVQYSIFPLLWVLLGGAGTTIGPFVGALFMFYLIDYSSALTNAYMLIAGVVLVLLTLFARTGLMGEVRKRWAPWLP